MKPYVNGKFYVTRWVQGGHRKAPWGRGLKLKGLQGAGRGLRGGKRAE